MLRFATGVGIVLVGIAVYLNSIYGFSVDAVSEMFAAGWDFTSGQESSLVRGEQFTALLQEWYARPFFGAGHGASAAGSIRSIEMPWAYELSYVALLFHTGMLGFLAYTAGVVWIFWMGVRIIRLRQRTEFIHGTNTGWHWRVFSLPTLPTPILKNTIISGSFFSLSHT